MNGWSGSDHVEWIAENIGDDQRDEPTGTACPGESSALDTAELFSDRVEFADIRTAGGQFTGEELFFGER